MGPGGWAAALVLPLAISGCLVAVRGHVFTTNASLVLVLAVLVAALVGGRTGGVVGAVVATLCFDFFFTRPYYSFVITRRADVETAVVLLVVGLVVGELVVRSRRRDARAAAREREAEQIRHVAELAAGGSGTGRLVTIVTDEVVATLGARKGRFERPPYATVLPGLGHGRITVPGSEEADGRPFGPAGEVALAVRDPGESSGAA
jgi:K+-sensing histidine kinase KdpD